MASLFNPLGCSSTRDSTDHLFFVHKKDSQSLNGVIDLSTYQPVYNIKIIFMSTIFLHEQRKSNTTYNHKISMKSPHCDAVLS